MRLSIVVTLIGAVVFCALASFVVWPQIDLAISGLFAESQKGFFWVHAWPVKTFVGIAYYGARILGLAMLAGTLIAYLSKRPFLKLSGKAWLFLFVGLLLGPGLVANVIFKDNWGRARPRAVVEFGGTAPFSPPLLMHQACDKNCSFVSGDAAFGFYLPSFAYVVSRRRSRRVFWAGIMAGCVFGAARVVSGAHFFSDVFFAAFFMLLTTALLHGVLMGWKETRQRWLCWLGLKGFDGDAPM